MGRSCNPLHINRKPTVFGQKKPELFAPANNCQNQPYLASLRRMTPASPRNLEPNSTTLAGSGTLPPTPAV